MKTFMIHGPSGSGKDTQINKLVEKFPNKFERIATGDMFRTNFQQRTADGLEAHKYWGEGKWVPADLVYKMLAKWIQLFSEKEDWIFVSAVRAPSQIPLFDSLLQKYGRELDLFIHLKLSEEKAVERMSLRKICPVCGAIYHSKYKPEKKEGFCDNDDGKLFPREDDKPEIVKVRIQEYNRTIEPILAEYQSRGVLKEIDADQSIEAIHEEFIEVMDLGKD
ncbi:AAA family ATPase [Candidatus Dojkabacteria bacterium]|nr:AAA family ATPase [Candidatus Dojkabacteria bacterium]